MKLKFQKVICTLVMAIVLLTSVSGAIERSENSCLPYCEGEELKELQ